LEKKRKNVSSIAKMVRTIGQFNLWSSPGSEFFHFISPIAQLGSPTDEPSKIKKYLKFNFQLFQINIPMPSSTTVEPPTIAKKTKKWIWKGN